MYGLIIISLVLFIFGVFVALYVLNSLGIYRLAQNRELENPWLAWIPIVNLYLIGELTGNTMWGIKGSKWILCLSPIVIPLIALTGIGVIIAAILNCIYVVYYFMILYRLYRIYNQSNAVLFLILAIIFPFTRPIFNFVIRNNKPDLNILNESSSFSESENTPVQDHDELEKTFNESNQSQEQSKSDPFKIEKRDPNNEMDLNELNNDIENINKTAQKEIDNNPKEDEINLHL